MCQEFAGRSTALKRTLLINTALAVATCLSPAAQAPPLYVDVSASLGRYESRTPFVFDVDDHHGAYKALVSIRPRRNLAFEVSHADWGGYRSMYRFGIPRVTADLRSASTAVVGYLPPARLAVFGKAGVSYRHSQLVSEIAPGCEAAPCTMTIMRTSRERDGLEPASGVGVQWQLNQLAVRTEYEPINADGGAVPESLGVTWTFQ